LISEFLIPSYCAFQGGTCKPFAKAKTLDWATFWAASTKKKKSSRLTSDVGAADNKQARCSPCYCEWWCSAHSWYWLLAGPKKVVLSHSSQASNVG
jgi:hypothetical protein